MKHWWCSIVMLVYWSVSIRIQSPRHNPCLYSSCAAVHPWLFLSFSDTRCVSFPELLMRISFLMARTCFWKIEKNRCCLWLMSAGLQRFYRPSAYLLVPLEKWPAIISFTPLKKFICSWSLWGGLPASQQKRVPTDRVPRWLRITALVLDELLLLEINGFCWVIPRPSNSRKGTPAAGFV